MNDAPRDRNSGSLRLIAGAFFQPSQWGKALEELADAFREWRSSRRWKMLWAGLPSLVVLGAAACVAVILMGTPQHSRVQAYIERADLATRDGDMAKALLCRQRIVREEPAVLEHQLRLAEAYRATDDLRTYATLISTLAPDGRMGYGPAHLVRARDLLSLPGTGQAVWIVAAAHLNRTLEADPKNPEAHILLGRVEGVLGNLESAERHLAAATADRPAVGMELARVYLRQGKRPRARQAAEAVCDFLRSELSSRPDDVVVRLGLADALMFLEDFPAALATLDEGERSAPRPEFRQAAARVYVFWSDTLQADRRPAESTGVDPALAVAAPSETSPPKPVRPDPAKPEAQAQMSRRVELLDLGIRANPNEPLLFSRLVDVLRTEKGRDADQLRTLLERMLVEGRSLPLVHLVLGTHALTQERYEQARLHLEQARRLNPNSITTVNNLAWTLAHADPPDLKTALKLMDDVVASGAVPAACRDTRGRILAKMGRWKEALVDLEAVLPAMTENKGLHLALAEVYEHLDQPTLAAEHKRTAEQLKNP